METLSSLVIWGKLSAAIEWGLNHWLAAGCMFVHTWGNLLMNSTKCPRPP